MRIAPCRSISGARADGRYIPITYLCDDYDYDCSENYDESEELCSGEENPFYIAWTLLCVFFAARIKWQNFKPNI